MPTLPPCSAPMQPSPAPSLALLPMPTVPPFLAPVQPFLAPLPAPLPMPALHLPHLSHVRAAISFDNLFSTVLHNGHGIAPHDKPWENRDMALFEMGPESYWTAMVARKRQPTAFALIGAVFTVDKQHTLIALWTAAKPGVFRLDRPWDTGITFGSHGLKPQHLDNKVFLMGQRMLGGRKQTSKSTTEGTNQRPKSRITQAPGGFPLTDSESVRGC
ncbi:hypothetical protein GmHk_10G028458 [Glycine max]|nr:hypothetical protein GmHk_10G028458 [Glycine max]